MKFVQDVWWKYDQALTTIADEIYDEIMMDTQVQTQVSDEMYDELMMKV